MGAPEVEFGVVLSAAYGERSPAQRPRTLLIRPRCSIRSPVSYLTAVLEPFRLWTAGEGKHAHSPFCNRLCVIARGTPVSRAERARSAGRGDKYCRAKVARLCPGVPMGGGRIIACLKAHKEEMSIGCGKALQAMKAKMGN